jgi:hypothetical protein
MAPVAIRSHRIDVGGHGRFGCGNTFGSLARAAEVAYAGAYRVGITNSAGTGTVLTIIAFFSRTTRPVVDSCMQR